MKKFLRTLFIALAVFLLPLCANAYNVVDLPASMTFSDALGIFDTGDINSITVSNIADGTYIALDEDGIKEFYNTVADKKVYRSINPTPFRAIAINIFTNNGAKTYCINSGLQIGLFGNSNYICYKLSDSDTEDILYLASDYWDNTPKSKGETVHPVTDIDFLKMPSAAWSKTFVSEAAAKSLLPYEFTGIYSNNISREQFCILIANMLAVKGGYYSIEDYMSDIGAAYLKNYFDDCENADSSVNILYALGIVNGKDETHFDPGGELTREEAATILSKTAEKYWELEIGTSLSYEDAWLVSDWARFYVTWVTENNIMSGITDEAFVPQGAYTVEQAIATIVRLNNLV